MNSRQVAIVWLSLTLGIPSGYFAVAHGLEIERSARENRAIRQGSDGGTREPSKYLVSFEEAGKKVTYEVTSNGFPASDEETERLIAVGRKLSDREAKAWEELAKIEASRRFYWEVAGSAAFVFASLMSLFFYRARRDEHIRSSQKGQATGLAPK